MTATAWAIKDWDRHFERAASRRYETTSYVPIRNDHNSTAFKVLMQTQQGRAYFGLFIAAAQVASRCPTRGVFVMDERPLTDAEIASKIGCPLKAWVELTAALSGPEYGRWLYRTPWHGVGTVQAPSENGVRTVHAPRGVTVLTRAGARAQPINQQSIAAGGDEVSPEEQAKRVRFFRQCLDPLPEGKDPISLSAAKHLARLPLDEETVTALVSEAKEGRRRMRNPAGWLNKQLREAAAELRKAAGATR